MAVALGLDSLGNNIDIGGSVKAAGTNNLAITNFSAGSIPAGTLVLAMIAADNLNATTPTVSSISAPAGESATWSKLAGHGASSATGAAAVVGELWAILLAVGWASIDTAIVTLSSSVTAKAAMGTGFTGATKTLRGTAGSGTSTAGAASATTAGTAPAAGDLVVGGFTWEGVTIFMQDLDTLNGPWAGWAAGGYGTSGGSATTNVTATFDYKIVTAGGHQTFDPTGAPAVDSGAVVLALVPAAGGPAAPNPRPPQFVRDRGLWVPAASGW